MIRGLAAILLVIAGFLMGVHATDLASRLPHRRPRYANRRAYGLLWGPARLGLIAAGLALAASASLALAVTLAVLLLSAAARRLYVKSGPYQRRMLREAFVDLCKQDPGVPREDLLAFLIQARHPRWDPEMIGQMIRDHPNVEGLLDALVRLERQVRE